MRWMPGIVNAVLMATLVKPVVRRMVARWRRRAQASAATTVGIPVQQLIETALIDELAPPAADLRPSTAETPEQLVDRGMMRAVLIAGALGTVIAVLVVAIAAVSRRRRKARETRPEESERVAVPVDMSIEEAEEAVPQEMLIE